MMALLIFTILSLIASTLVIFAAALSSRLSRQEDWSESYAYDNVKGNSDSSEPLCAQIVNR